MVGGVKRPPRQKIQLNPDSSYQTTMENGRYYIKMLVLNKKPEIVPPLLMETNRNNEELEGALKKVNNVQNHQKQPKW